MARIRNVKPEFFRSETVAQLSMRARLLWIGLWTECDNFGRARDNARLLKGAVWPLDDVSLEDIEEDLAALEELGCIRRYGVDSKRYLCVPNWDEHQYGAGKGNPKYPGPPDRPNKSGRDVDEYGTGLDDSGQGVEKSAGIQGLRDRGQGEGTRGSATPRPPKSRTRCNRHAHLPADDPGPACVACRDMRLATEQADRAPVPPPVWCGECDETTRHHERPDGRVVRCRDCHPLRSVS